MLQALLRKYNAIRKEKIFQDPLFHTQKKYAFIGVGMHSLSNYYPLVRHFNIQLKYICTKASDWSRQLGPLFPGCVLTHNIEDITNDADVAGVFVCASPKEHKNILETVVKSNKPVFIDKPPCQDTRQLQDLLRQTTSQTICKLGLQRRYWPGNEAAIRRIRTATNYIYQFHTGPYPQGDILTELFIHPLDYIHYLFGGYTISSHARQKDASGLTAHLHLSHASGISGLIELSTHHSWNPPTESLNVTTKNGSLNIQYPIQVTGRPAPARLLNIPAERLLVQPAVTKEYYTAIPSMVPALDRNTLHTQGFHGELQTFISLVENGGTASTPRNDLPSLLQTYQTFDMMSL